MRRQAAILALASVLAVGVAASALYAQDSRHDGMTSPGGMMGMMGMMQQMGRMMDYCGQMMSANPRDGGRPNDQWRKQTPAPPGRNG
jgi:hypothetical protein